MRHAIYIIGLVALTGCKEIGSEASAPVTAPPTSMLKAQGCSASKDSEGKAQVQCSDGSQATMGRPAVHIKDINGYSMENLLYIGTFTATQIVLNTTSHNILSYDANGTITAVTRTYFDGPNCTGHAYTVPPDVVLKNKVMANSQAWPDNSVQALRIVGYANTVSAQSQYQSGACSASLGTVTHVTEIAATAFDASDPLTINGPFELVSE